MQNFSRGENASVDRVGTYLNECVMFPNADLVRTESSISPNCKRLFYMHKVASLLFPRNFIEVVAAREINSFSTRLYSRLADVPEEHAIFARDCFKPWGQEKRSICECRPCEEHRHFHDDHDLQQRAFELAKELQEWGIYVEYTDITDYCLDQKTGEIIFFEVFVDIGACRERISRQAGEESLRVQSLLDRLQVLK